MIAVGVIGLGMMGLTHLDVYAKRTDVRIAVIADANPDRLSGKERAGGNIEGQAQSGIDLTQVRQYNEGKDLINDNKVELVDICLPTPMHREYTEAALRAGKHVLVEKPLGRTAADAVKVADSAKKAKGLCMVAMCIRFWPGWDWLKNAIENQTYGSVLAAFFRRVAEHPGGPFYSNGELCGGALLDLHVHDTDIVQYYFGIPKAVSSRGYSKVTGEIDHVITQYHYDDVPLVTAEGGWVMAEGFGFKMQYTVNFERATATFEFDGENHLMLYEPGKKPQELNVGSETGYEREIAYFLNCVQKNEKPSVVTLDDAVNSLKIVEAENESIASGRPIAMS